MAKKGINGKAKGSGFELRVAKILSKWSGEEFNRVPQSGGLRWKSDNNVTGDIVPPFDMKCPVSFECKKVEIDWDFNTLLEQTTDIWDWWKQSSRDSNRSTTKEPWLIFCKNYRRIFLMVRAKAYNHLANKNPRFSSLPCAKVVSGVYDTVIIDFEHALETLSVEDMLSLSELL